MSLIRTNKRENHFAQIDKRLLEDERLSWKAKGILCYLMSKPNDWQIISEDLINKSSDGRDAVRSAFKELKEFGYAELITVQNKETGLMGGRHWLVHETPINRLPENPTVGLTPPTNNDKTNNEINKKEKKIFEKPTIDKLIEYGTKKFGIVAYSTIEDFLDFYEDKGWKVGKTPMKRWDLAFNRWIRHNNPYPRHFELKVIQSPHPEYKNAMAALSWRELTELVRRIGCGEIKLSEKRLISRQIEDAVAENGIEKVRSFLADANPSLIEFLKNEYHI